MRRVNVVRSRRAITTELNRVQKRLRRSNGWSHTFLQGAQQALAWALRDDAQAPRKVGS